MYTAENIAMNKLYLYYCKNTNNIYKVAKIQLMPNDFGEIYIDNKSKIIEQDDFTFTMDINTLFAKTIPEQNIYVIEGICTSYIPDISIKHISFNIADKIIKNISGYQIKETYYFESPFVIEENCLLKIKVNMSDICTNFPIMFLGYKFFPTKV